MNQNRIATDRFSNPESERKYETLWADEPALRDNFYHNGRQCGGCSFYAPFDDDWGLCCCSKSRHHLETVFEHFTCPTHVNEGWGAHSFVNFDAYPELRKRLDLQFEIPDVLYDGLREVADKTGQTIYEMVLNQLFRILGHDSGSGSQSAGEE